MISVAVRAFPINPWGTGFQPVKHWLQTRPTVFGRGSRLDFCRLPGADSSRHRRKSRGLRFWDIRPGPSCSKKVGHVFGNPEDSAHSGPARMAKVELGPWPLRLCTTPTTCSPAGASRPWSQTQSPQEQTCGCDQNLISLLNASPDSQPRHAVSSPFALMPPVGRCGVGSS